MNFDFLRFESKLLRLLLGATFIIEAVVLGSRWTELDQALARWSTTLERLPGALSGGTLFLILLLFAALAGTRVLDGIALVLGLPLKFAEKLFLRARQPPALLLEPIEIARRIILAHRPAIREYHRLRGIGYAESSKHHEFLTKAIGQRMDEVERLIDGASPQDWHVITSIMNFGTVVQEQAITERLSERVATLKSFWIVLAMSGIVVVELLGWSAASLAALSVLLLATVASLVAFGAAKQEAAHHWVFLVYESIGQFSPGAQEVHGSA